MPNRWSALCLGAALGLIALSLTLALLRVYQLERSELAFEGDRLPLAEWRERPGASAVSARLAEVELRAGEHAVFEICADDPMTADVWRDGLAFAVFKLDPMELMLKVPLDAEHLGAVQRGRDGACLKLGAGPIEKPGRYTVDAVYPERPPPDSLLRVPLRARVLARLPLLPRDRALLIAAAAGCLLALLAGWLWRTASPRQTEVDGDAPHEPPRAVGRGGHLAAAAAALSLLVLATFAPLWGSTLGMLKGLLLSLVQVTAALVLGRKLGLPAALTRPSRPALHLGLALLSAPLLVLNARMALRLVPSTGEAPIETFISFPSGMLAFAVLGAVLPMAEELFFRGVVYGALVPWGRGVAFAASAAAFALIHAQQSWGNWGALVAITGTGLILTGLRALTGSVLPSALAHVLYNLSLSLGSW